MDPETEKHFAALIMEEATRLRLQADKEGVHAYLAKPTVRGKPNGQFLRATVRGIAQANRAAEVSGMWKRRALELEVEEREKKRRHTHKSDINTKCSNTSSHSYHSPTKKATSRHRKSYPTSSSPRLQERYAVDSMSEEYKDDSHLNRFEDDLGDQGLREEEVEQFLHSRVKRGRGAVGSRMDETGPYLSVHSVGADFPNVRIKEEWEKRIIGPSLEFGERHLVDFEKHRTKKREVADEVQHTASHKVEKREKKKKKHRSVHHKHRSGGKRSDMS